MAGGFRGLPYLRLTGVTSDTGAPAGPAPSPDIIVNYERAWELCYNSALRALDFSFEGTKSSDVSALDAKQAIPRSFDPPNSQLKGVK